MSTSNYAYIWVLPTQQADLKILKIGAYWREYRIEAIHDNYKHSPVVTIGPLIGNTINNGSQEHIWLYSKHFIGTLNITKWKKPTWKGYVLCESKILEKGKTMEITKRSVATRGRVGGRD